MVIVIAKSNTRTKSFLSSVVDVSAAGLMLVMLTSCVSLDLFGGDKVDKSLSTASVPNQQSGPTLTDDATIRNAVTSADIAKLADSPLPWANAATGSAGVVTAIREDSTLLAALHRSLQHHCGEDRAQSFIEWLVRTGEPRVVKARRGRMVVPAGLVKL